MHRFTSRFFAPEGAAPTATPAAPAATPAAATPAPAAAAAAATPAATAATPAAATPAPGAPAAAAAEAPAATATPAPAAATPPVVPDKYELALPAGSPLDQSDVDAVAAMAKAKGWTQEQASAALAEVHQHTVDTTARFLSTTQAHPEVGGAHLEAAQLAATRVLDRFLPATTSEGAELRTALNKSGYGNYAPLLVLLSRVGKAMGEDRPIDSSRSTTPGQAKSHAEVLYGAPPIK